jgi:uncharacterized membrane protein
MTSGGSGGPGEQADEPPAWRRPTHGETRWTSAVAIGLVAGLQFALPERLQARPRYGFLAVEVALLAIGILMNPRRLERRDPMLRRVSLALNAILFATVAWSGTALVVDLLTGHSSRSPGTLLRSGGTIYVTNVLVFALWFWELDRGGPVDRAQGVSAFPDFLFPQMQAGDLVSNDWEPTFLDYVYVSFTNVTAFSPTDTLPLSRWAKLLMMLQATLSILLVVLVIARAVNVLQ